MLISIFILQSVDFSLNFFKRKTGAYTENNHKVSDFRIQGKKNSDSSKADLKN